jgi:hypothetical protein
MGMVDLLTTMTHYHGVMVLHRLRAMMMNKAQQAMQRAQTMSIVVWALGIFYVSFILVFFSNYLMILFYF